MSINACTRKKFNSSSSMVLTNAECLFTKNRLLENIPSAENPMLIIKYGPTGSGKGSEKVKQEIESLGQNIDDYVTLEIDLLVESINSYRSKTVSLKQRKNKGSLLIFLKIVLLHVGFQMAGIYSVVFPKTT